MPPNLPGLISSINPAIKVGGAVYLFDIAWLLGVRFSLTFFLVNISIDVLFRQFTLASFVYYTASVLFPARDTMIDEAIYDDEKSDEKSDRSGVVDEKALAKISEVAV